MRKFMDIVSDEQEPAKQLLSEGIEINDHSEMSAEEILKTMNMRQRYDAMQKTPDRRYDQVLDHIRDNLPLYRQKMSDHESRFSNIDDGGIHRIT